MRLYTHLRRLRLPRMSDKDHVVIMTLKVDNRLNVHTSCFHLLLYCPYTDVMLMLYCSYYTYICYCYVWAPPLRGWYAGSQPLLITSTYRGHIQIPIWPLYVRYAIKMVVHCSDQLFFIALGFASCMGYPES